MARNQDKQTYQLIFDESRRSLARQEASVDELRSRTSWLISTVALVSSFLGSVALDDGRVSSLGFVAAFWFVCGTLLALVILWPWNWTFRLGTKEFVEDYVEHPTKPLDLPELQRNAALQIEGFVIGNDRTLGRLYWAFRGLTVTIGLQVVFWLAELVTNPNPLKT